MNPPRSLPDNDEIATQIQSMLRVVGARTHNLRDVSLEIPHNELTVFSGVSGSGKSSLAFDTIFAEGQRQYIESLSTYARQFLSQMQRADVQLIEGLQPTLCIDQRAGAANPRSTVATLTEIYDYLRLLMARLGTALCYSCGTPIQQQSAGQILQKLMALPEGTKLVVLAPVVCGRKGHHRDALARIEKAGLVGVRVDGELLDISSVAPLAPRKNHTIEAVVDKIVIRQANAERLAGSIDTALQLGDGVLVASYRSAGSDDAAEALFSTKYACANCGASIEEIEPRTFSFNSPYGACPTCDGIGFQQSVQSAKDRDDLPQPTVYRDEQICQTCHGARLRPEALAVKLAGRNIHDIVSATILESLAWFESTQIPADKRPIAVPILNEMLHRLRFLVDVGLGYLTLARPAETLSGGEFQRVRLATCIGSGLVGVCYVLDEPSIGLHQRDNNRLIASVRKLQAQGNTVIVVEHDESMMLAADRVVDFGPGAGSSGGMIVAQGTPAAVRAAGKSLTAEYLRGERRVTPERARRDADQAPRIRLTKATLHNLKSITVELPLGLMVGVTGVSGSGKSSLISETLIPALAKQMGVESARPGPYGNLSGYEHIDKLIEITQASVGRTPRSTPATYCGVFDLIRAVWANTRESKQRGFRSNRFSFNAGPGRCPNCQGQGQQRIEMNFLADLFVTCSTCNGSRYNRQTLEIRYRGKTIADVLDMSIDQAREFFENFSKISRLLDCLQQVGLGYLTLGQSSSTLSGGEAQRIKLATELARPETGKALYFLDEPTTGLHFEDVRQLMLVLNGLVDRGNTVVIVEHHLDVIRACDWILDIGPEAGEAGGHIVASGPPETIASAPASITGKYL
ncbi:MAG: excinuclease ABC subunit UvrA [Planctomycetales bacterium]|nr:excinuclease ABC subunit UvrA [Planctomycetales bacterium]